MPRQPLRRCKAGRARFSGYPLGIGIYLRRPEVQFSKSWTIDVSMDKFFVDGWTRTNGRVYGRKNAQEDFRKPSWTGRDTLHSSKLTDYLFLKHGRAYF